MSGSHHFGIHLACQLQFNPELGTSKNRFVIQRKLSKLCSACVIDSAVLDMPSNILQDFV